MRAVLCVLVSGVLTGCGTLDKAVSHGYGPRDLDGKALEPYQALVATLTTASTAGGTALVPKKCFEVPIAAADAPTCKASRNAAVSTLLFASTQVCLDHRRSIYGREAAANITLGTLSNLAAGGAAVATLEARKTLLAALALFFNSERSLVNETVYKQMIVTAVDQKIVESTRSKAEAIDRALGKSIDEYGLSQSLSDVISLHNSCSFMEGLRLALQEGTQAATPRMILTLRQNLASVANEVASACRVPAPGGGDSFVCTQSKGRYESITNQLKVVEASTQ